VIRSLLGIIDRLGFRRLALLLINRGATRETELGIEARDPAHGVVRCVEARAEDAAALRHWAASLSEASR